LLIVALAAALLVASAASAAPVPWADALRDAALEKQGLARLHNPRYQYLCLGLGGTTLRVGPHGFTRPGAPGVSPESALEHLPYLAFQHWWDEDGHRHYPFHLTGGYGDGVDPGEIVSFRQRLDVRNGVLTVDLGFRLTSGARVRSRRTLFVTPEGVIVVRVSGSAPAGGDFRLRVEPNRNVRLYHNAGIYARPHEPWSSTASAFPGGIVATATRPRTCVAALAVAGDAGVRPAAERSEVRAVGKATVTLYIAPASSYECPNATSLATARAQRARREGYDALLARTAAWWRAFYARSEVDLPDALVARWYARSVYLHGVYFGTTDVPPGCNGTGPLFSGAVCPEFDLPFSQFALLATNRFAEARRVARWIVSILPRAERYAREGLTLHRERVQYASGAVIGPLVGRDGAIVVPPTEAEGIHAYERYPGANAAAMALGYVDASGDASLRPGALRVLREAARVSVADLEWRDDLGGWLDRHMGNSVQQAAARFLLEQSISRGVADAGWDRIARRVVTPISSYKGQPVIVIGHGFVPKQGDGDAPWLQGLWWYGCLRPDDPLARNTYRMLAQSKTGTYVFNNGWMAVYAAILGDAEGAQRWLGGLLRPEVTIHDDTCFGEIVHDADDFRKTPEVGAHGALVCAVARMLVGSGRGPTIAVFPALPRAWAHAGVRFRRLALPGGLLVSASWSSGRLAVRVESRARVTVRRVLRVRVPSGWRVRSSSRSVRLLGGWAVTSPLTLRPGRFVELRIVAERQPASPPGTPHGAKQGPPE